MVFYARKRSFKSTGWTGQSRSFAAFKRRRVAAVGRRRTFRRRSHFRRWRPKWSKHHHRKPNSQKIVMHRKSHRDMPPSLDRDHQIMEKTWKGTMTWTVGSQAYTSLSLTNPFNETGQTDRRSGFPHANIWTNAGTTSTYSSSGQAPAFVSENVLANRWMYAYTSSVTVTWKMSRTDHGDDELLYATMVPVMGEQQAASMTGTFPNLAFVGTGAELQWERSQLIANHRTTRLTNPLGSKALGYLRMHIPIKKYWRAGYPLDSPSDWYSVLPGPTYTSPLSGPILWLGMYNNGSANPVLIDHEITMKFYVTYFTPQIPSTVTYYPTGPLAVEAAEAAAEAKEGKEEKKEEKSDDDYDEVAECLKLVKPAPLKRTVAATASSLSEAVARMSVTSPPPMGPPPPRPGRAAAHATPTR